MGLALSTAIAAYVNAWLLYRGLQRHKVYKPGSNWPKIWLRYGGANLLMAFSLLLGLHYFNGWQLWGVGQRIVHLLLLCTAGGAVYLLGLVLFGFRLKDFRAPH